VGERLREVHPRYRYDAVSIEQSKIRVDQSLIRVKKNAPVLNRSALTTSKEGVAANPAARTYSDGADDDRNEAQVASHGAHTSHPDAGGLWLR
jgi:hypothetical protein